MSETERPRGGHHDDGRTLRYTRQLLSDNHHELRRADARANQVLGVAGAAAATALAVTPDGMLASLAGGWQWWGACALWFVAVTAAVIALLPRIGGASPQWQVSYFGDVARQEDLVESLHRTAEQPLSGAVSELRWTSSRVVFKYRLVRGAIVCLAAAGVLLGWMVL
ncbi:Pycsar system effector family protein [Micromonospora echinofusca]|uniref:Pycsar system effector family protein n=1 Tax=Micromonospora echinofusca TaxID=47858 RepID=UPI0034012095